MGLEKSIDEQVAELYRTESRRILATLIRLLGDFDLAEEALQEAFRAALEQWPREGLPRNPRAWLVYTGRFKGIDIVRRRARHDALLATVAQETREAYLDPEGLDDEALQDDQLRLIFTCCHPALPQDGRVALALREVCGLTTEEIARAFLVTTATMTRRIARAKERIRKERLPYEVPSRQELARRLATVHAVAPSVEATDWAQVVRLYDMLLETSPSPVVELNRAIAVAMRDGPTAGLSLVDALLDRGELLDYHPAHAVRADLNRRLGRIDEAAASYGRALRLARQEPERRFLEKRLAEISG
jgi:RNA polymerase sigma factor (sigma-70 family)